MTHRLFRTTLLLALALLLVPTAFAQEDAERKDAPAARAIDPAGAPGAEAMDAVALAYELAGYGMATDSPYALLAAARILIDNPVSSLEDAEQTEGAEAPDAMKDRDSDEHYTALSLISAARERAGDDDALLAAADALEPMARQRGARGAVGGPYETVDRVLAYSTDTWRITFRGGEPARLAVIGDGDTDLDVYVYDENGYLITSDTDYTDNNVLAWNPVWTGPFVIQIRNLGGVYNRYVLMTN